MEFKRCCLSSAVFLAMAAAAADDMHTFSRCIGEPLHWDFAQSKSGEDLMLRNLTAELQLSVSSVQTDYIWEYDAKTRKWVHAKGSTLLQFSANLTSRTGTAFSASSDMNLVASVHRAQCTNDLELTHTQMPYLYDKTLPANEANTLTSSVTAPLSSGSKSLLIAISAEAPWLASVDQVQSVVLSQKTEKGIVPLGCCGLVPQMPKLPNDWSATIEANFLKPEVSKMYTLNRHEIYSVSMDATRISSKSHGHSMTHIMLAAKNKTFTLHDNETFAKGICEQKSVGQRAGSRMITKGHHLKSTVDLFMLPHESESYFAPGCADCEVRGVPCEKWVRQMKAFRPGGPSYSVSYFFMTVDWRMRHKDDWHRHLMRVLLDGTYPNGTKVKHVYEFINFDAIQPRADDFDPCLVFADLYPKGDSSACGCTAQQKVCTAQEEKDESPAMQVAKAALFVTLGVVLAVVGRCIVDRCCGSSNGHNRFEDGGAATIGARA